MTEGRRRIASTVAELRHDWRVLALIAAFAGVTWFLAELTDEVTEGGTRELDRAVLLALRSQGDLGDPLGPAWLEVVMRDLTALGGIGVLTLVTVAALGYALLQRRWRVAATILVAVLGGVLISTLAKQLIDRTRPELVPHAVEVSTASFPSGHSMMAATVYFTLAALAMQFQSRRGEQLYLVGVAVVLTGVVGWSRIYLGVHWPTDVLAGWTIGAVWALLVWFAIEGLQQAEGLLHRA